MANPIDRASEGAGHALMWLYGVAACVTLYEVSSRFLFRSPTVWAIEVVTAICAVCFLFGGAYCQRFDRHIRIGYLVDRTPGGRRFSSALSLVCAIGFLAAMIYGGWLQFVDSIWNPHIKQWKFETTGRAWNVPLPPFIKGLLLLACVLMLAQALVAYRRKLAGEAKAGA
jgi:TRAP-type C4-dicarboxylate transport system permease small subunit